MLRKKERLTKKDFNRFFSLGTRLHSPALMLVYYPHEELHAAVVVPKKVVKSAVARNRLRRQGYEILRTYNKKHSLTGVYIVVLKQTGASLPFTLLHKELTQLLGATSKPR